MICAGTYTGKWDWKESKCVKCSGGVEYGYYECEGVLGVERAGDLECESACGADSECDENGMRTEWDECKNLLLKPATKPIIDAYSDQSEDQA